MKRFKKICIFFGFLLFFTMMVVPTPAYAATTPDYTGADAETIDGINNQYQQEKKEEEKKEKEAQEGIDFGVTYPDKIKKKVYRKVAYSLVYTVLSGNLSTTMKEAISSSGITKVIFGSTVKGFYDTVAKLGTSIVIVYFLSELLEQATRENFSLEQLFKLLLKLLIAKLLLENGFTLMQIIMNTANGLAADIVMNFKDPTNANVLTEWTETIEDAGIMECIFIVIQWLIPYILTFISRIAIFMVLYSRYIEMALRVAAAPIGMSDIFSHGTQSKGFQYLRKFAAVCLQTFVILIIIFVGALCQSYIMQTGGLSVVVGCLVFNLTVAGMVVKSGHIANDIMGV